MTVVTAGAGYGGRITIYSMLAVRQRFRDKRIRVLPLRAVQAVEHGGLVLEDLSTVESERLSGIDTIVAAAAGGRGRARARAARPPPRSPDGGRLRRAPRTALEAIFEGHAAGRAV